MCVSRTDGFADFWQIWPASDRKVAKKACRAKWEAKNFTEIAATIIADVQAKKATEQWQKGFEPAPLTYLNQERWNDGATTQSSPWAGAIN